MFIHFFCFWYGLFFFFFYPFFFFWWRIRVAVTWIRYQVLLIVEILVFFLFSSVFIMVIAEAQVFQEIKNEMETLSSGGKQVVDTHVTGSSARLKLTLLLAFTFLIGFGSTIVAGIFICGLSFFLFLKHGIQILQLRVVIAKTDKAYREAADLQDLVDAYQKRARIRANMTMLEARARAGWENPNPRTTKKQLPRLRVF